MPRRTDLLAGLVFCALGLAFGTEALSYRFGSPARMGSGFFPLVLSVALFALGVLAMLRGVRPAPDSGEVDWGNVAPFALILGAIGLFAVLLGTLGYLGSAFLTVLVASLAGPPLSVATRLIQAAVLTGTTTLIFVWALGVPLPLWPSVMN